MSRMANLLSEDMQDDLLGMLNDSAPQSPARKRTRSSDSRGARPTTLPRAGAPSPLSPPPPTRSPAARHTLRHPLLSART